MISIVLIGAVVLFNLSPWTLFFLILTSFIDLTAIATWKSLRERKEEDNVREVKINFIIPGFRRLFNYENT